MKVTIRVLGKVRLLLMLSFFIGCSKYEKVNYLYSNENKKVFYKIIRKKDSMILIKENTSDSQREIDSVFYVLKGNEFYEKSEPTPFSKDNESLRFTTLKDTSYFYAVVNTKFKCEIKKVSNKFYKTVFSNCDTTNYKYAYSIYFDDNYSINKIEEINNNKKYVFK